VKVLLKGRASGDSSFHKLRRGATGRTASRDNVIGSAAVFDGTHPRSDQSDGRVTKNKNIKRLYVARLSIMG
jgi:hypothetical protein